MTSPKQVITAHLWGRRGGNVVLEADAILEALSARGYVVVQRLDVRLSGDVSRIVDQLSET